MKDPHFHLILCTLDISEEGRVSQIFFYLGPRFYFMKCLKNC